MNFIKGKISLFSRISNRSCKISFFFFRNGGCQNLTGRRQVRGCWTPGGINRDRLSQYWMLSKTGEIRRDESCLDYSGSDVILYPCHGSKGNQQWIYNPQVMDRSQNVLLLIYESSNILRLNLKNSVLLQVVLQVLLQVLLQKVNPRKLVLDINCSKGSSSRSVLLFPD